MAKSARRAVKLFFMIIILAAGFLLIYLSPAVQKYLYPLPEKALVFQYAAENKLDPYLVAAVIRVESRFSAQAESPSGARGLMQLMPDTAQWAAERMGIGFRAEQLFQAEYNIRMGCWYLRELLDEYDGNLTAALAAYNGGRGNVGSWLAEGTWDGTLADLSAVPFPETKRYVERVMQAYHRYQVLYDGSFPK